MGPVSRNAKTIRSLDLSTICPKLRTGNPCSYCYVAAARRNKWHAKLLHDRIPYRGELRRFRPDLVQLLNSVGGLRLFSFGDYMDWMDEDLERVIGDANKIGLLLKAITKQPSFVHKYHDWINVINVSVDTLGEGVPHDTAKALRQEYPNVFIRGAVMSFADLQALAWVDILTLNHATNGYHRFSINERSIIAAALPDRVCCVTGHCVGCPIKCGAAWIVERGVRAS